jgi:hypothetical protein
MPILLLLSLCKCFLLNIHLDRHVYLFLTLCVFLQNIYVDAPLSDLFLYLLYGCLNLMTFRYAY